jgi:surface antigen
MGGDPIGRFTWTYAWVRALARFATLATIVVATLFSVTSVASANVSATYHEEPWTGVAGVSQSSRCTTISPSYACTVGGYATWLTNPSGWAWSFYGGSEPSHNSFGPHNCTLYVAYRLQQRGITLAWSSNAYDWASAAADHGASVNQTPTPGSVAQWNTGHIAYVDQVTSHYILITSDNYQPYGAGTMPGGFTDSFIISLKSPAMPDNFVHFPAPGPTPVAVLAVTHAS